MSIQRTSIAKDVIGPERLTPSQRMGRYCLETFMMPPLVRVKGSVTDITPTGTSLTEQILFTGRHTFEYYFLNENTDLLVPTLDTTGGYNWGGSSDVVETGFEINFGGLVLGHPRNFKPYATDGTGENCFARILLLLDDASGADVFFGFRKVAAPAATLTEYSDVVGIRMLGASGSTDATFSLITNLNNAGATDYTATTPIPAKAGLEDSTLVELEVRAVAGSAQFFINGVQYTGVSYAFDSGDVVAPVCRILQATDIAALVKTMAFECGLLEDRQDATLTALAQAST